jgi:hypothetical protein
MLVKRGFHSPAVPAELDKEIGEPLWSAIILYVAIHELW